MKELLSVSKNFWTNEVEEIEHYFNEQVNKDLPPQITEQLEALKTRLSQLE